MPTDDPNARLWIVQRWEGLRTVKEYPAQAAQKRAEEAAKASQKCAPRPGVPGFAGAYRLLCVPQPSPFATLDLQIGPELTPISQLQNET